MAVFPAYINIVFEDRLSAAIIERLLEFSPKKVEINRRISGYGSGYIRKRISAYQKASQYEPFFILLDADNEDCALNVLNALVPPGLRQPKCLLRIAVREVEAWLLADAKGISRFMGISEALVNRSPESLADAKGHLLGLARRSRKKEITEGLLPAPRTSAVIGPEYNQVLSVFVERNWDVRAAARRSESLSRALGAVEKLAR